MRCKGCKKPTPDQRSRRHYACYKIAMFPRLGIRDDLTAYAGMLQKDVAAALGVSYVQFRRYVRKAGLRGLFPAWGGASAQIAQKGYTGEDI